MVRRKETIMLTKLDLFFVLLIFLFLWVFGIVEPH